MKKYLYIIGLFIFTTLPAQSKLNKADKLFENKLKRMIRATKKGGTRKNPDFDTTVTGK